MNTAAVLPIIASPIIGSFLTVLATRLPTGESWAISRSKCRSCGHQLGIADLVPIFSWLVRNGTCRYCHASISAVYPAIEICAVGIALWSVWIFDGWLVWASCGLGWTLLTLAVIDFREFLLPDALTLPLIPVGLLVAYFLDPLLILHHVIGAAGGYLFLVIVEFAYKSLRKREGLGRGDAKLFAAAGAWLGWEALPTVLFLAAASALIYVLFNSFKTAKAISSGTKLSFGPFLALGTWILWIFG